LLIDLRKRKSQLVAEFKAFLDRVEVWRGDLPEWMGTLRPRDDYDRWDFDRSRKVAWLNLKVYKRYLQKWEFEFEEERRNKITKKRLTFNRIALELGIKEGYAKQCFYRAYKQIHGVPYNKDHFVDVLKLRIDAQQVPQSCADCPARSTCTEKEMMACPTGRKILVYAEMDFKPQREKPIGDPLFEE
jgi:hypothetical protein